MKSFVLHNRYSDNSLNFDFKIKFMNELLIPFFIFSIWIVFSLIFIKRFKRNQTNHQTDKKSFWNNSYIFDSIPPVFPTLGIFCTALGITIGIWNFNPSDIQGSIPELLKGLRLAFIATMAGILGLVVFQKVIAIVQQEIDEDPNRPRKKTDELSAIAELTYTVDRMSKENNTQIDRLIMSLGLELEEKVGIKLSKIEDEVVKLQSKTQETQKNIIEGHTQIITTSIKNKTEVVEQLIEFSKQQKDTSEKANKNTEEIIEAMNANNKLISEKFDEFTDLLAKNNTEALVEVMKKATEQFNSQMSELINKLVKENFAELNNSVKNLNDWQKQNKEQVEKLTEHFQKTTELFSISSNTLNEVSKNTNELVKADSKLNLILVELNKVLIEDSKFQEISDKISNTINTLENTTDSFEETTNKLNDWIKTEKNFKEAAQIIISKLEEFRDFNGNVWDKYRSEMSKSVSIIKETSSTLSKDIDKINAEFYERLNDTLQNLDQCIQRFIPTNRK